MFLSSYYVWYLVFIQSLSDDLQAHSCQFLDRLHEFAGVIGAFVVEVVFLQRIVKLTGEAYFDVHRDTLHPFVVKARGIEVKVLGTAFCVKSDSEAGKVSVLLERGSVRLQSPEGVGLVRLSPDQMAEFDAKTGDIEVTPMAAEPYIVQHYNKVTLQQVSIDGIISHIERMYGIKVQALSPVDTTKKYNLNYKRTFQSSS